MRPNDWLVWVSEASGPLRETSGTSNLVAMAVNLPNPALPADSLAFPLIEDRVKRGQLIIGSGDRSDVVVPDSELSALHVILQFDGGRWSARDGGRTTGTWLNGIPL